MRKINIDSVINPILFLYIVSLYLLTYRPLLNQISNVIAMLLITSIMMKLMITKTEIILNKLLVSYMIFILICLLSLIFAINPEVSIIQLKTLVLLWTLMFVLINYITNLEKIKMLMSFYVYSGFFASIYIIITSDFTQMTRFGSDLGNVNAIGMIIGISTIFCFYFIYEEKKSIYIPIFLINFTIILLTGSRKALIFVIISIVIIAFSKGNSNIKNKFKLVFTILIVLIIVFYLITNVPLLYNVIGKRVENLLDFFGEEGTTEASINIREDMARMGWRWFTQKPLTGYGIDNYRFLYGPVSGFYTYSHNNIIELLVGIGVVGSITYYWLQIVLIKDLLKKSKIATKTLCYSFVAIIFSYLILSFGLVYYYDKHFVVILAVASTILRLKTIEIISN